MQDSQPWVALVPEPTLYHGQGKDFVGQLKDHLVWSTLMQGLGMVLIGNDSFYILGAYVVHYFDLSPCCRFVASHLPAFCSVCKTEFNPVTGLRGQWEKEWLDSFCKIGNQNLTVI